MTDEIVFPGTTLVRRLRLGLAPGEAMPWHRDPLRRIAVILGGDLLSIEYAMEAKASALRLRRGRSSGKSRAIVSIGR